MNSNTLVQTQKAKQVHRLSAKDVFDIRILEMPITELEKKVEEEQHDNFALEGAIPKESPLPQESSSSNAYNSFFKGESNSQFDDDYYESENKVITSQKTFLDNLIDQIKDYNLSKRQTFLVEYLIGSLNDKGYIDMSISDIAYDLLIYHNLEVTDEELEKALTILQQFEPAGIGARDTKECLLLQLKRMPQSDIRDKAIEAIDKYSHLIENNQWEKIATKLKLTDDKFEKVTSLIHKLNPQPGLALTESISDQVQTIIPDFIIETEDSGKIRYKVNKGLMPPLSVNAQLEEQLKRYQEKKGTLSRKDKEAYEFIKNKVERAHAFIDAVNKREKALKDTIKTIIKMQRRYVLTQDPSTLKPMILKDVADQIGQHLSTVSRAKNNKYVMIDEVLHPMSDFFLRTRTNAEGEVVMGNKVKQIITEIIESEDKSNPLKDEEIEALLNKTGITICRRTVAKYRKSLGFQIATKRRSK